MAEAEFLKQMRDSAGTLPPTARLRLVLDELLAMVDSGVVSFRETPGSASTLGLYKPASAPVLWGANVTFKANDLCSFVHELTHARCILCYAADTVNYAPGGVNGVPMAFTASPPPGAPPGTVCLTTDCQIARRQAWFRAHCKTFLDTNLNNLRTWAEITDYAAPSPFMSAQQKKEIKQTVKAMSKGDATAMTKNATLNSEAATRGQVQKSGKWIGADAINEQRLDAEADRKKAWILERINYGLNGMSGLGDTHNEYDTVVNQMLYQMFLWGFRSVTPETLTITEIADYAKDHSLPSEHLYDKISCLAHEAHLRRMTGTGIGIGAAPTILQPAGII